MRFSRLIIVGLIILYVATFNWVYVTYLFPTFEYLGFSLKFPSLSVFLGESVLAIAPAIWLPIAIKRPSQVIYWMLYVTVYVPSMYVPAYVQLCPLGEVSAVSLALFAGFAAIGLTYAFPRIKISWTPSSPTVFWGCFAVVTVGLLGYVLLVYWGHFRLVSFQNVYADGVRSSGSSIAEGTLVGYAIMALGGVLYPLLIALGLARKRVLLFLAGSFGELLLYATAGQKGYILCPFMLGGVYVLLRYKRRISFGGAFPLIVTLLCIVLNFGHMADADNPTGLWAISAAVFFMRILGWPGLATAMYGEFFATHPYTYFSHVKGVSAFVGYPYESDIGHVIAYYNTGNPELNSNAHFWITDGLASCGVPGIFIISIVCAGVFWLLDSIAWRHGRIFGTLMCVFPGVLLGNASIFTTLWSGGLAGVMLILLVIPSTADAPDTVRGWMVKRKIIKPSALTHV